VDKYSNWLNGIVIGGVSVIAFLVGAIYGKHFCGLQWETLLAGFLGLTGGSFAYAAAKTQILANQKQRKNEKLNTFKQAAADFYMGAYFAANDIMEDAERFAPHFSDDEYAGDDICKMALETFREAIIPNPPFTVSSQIIGSVRQIRRAKRILMTSLENGIIATEHHAKRNQVIRLVIDEIIKFTKILAKQAKEGMEKLNENYGHYATPISNELKSVPTGDIDTRPTMPD
jgi:hypothetical protein